jgi:predicted GIY-YIG superfamily endonuclease
MLEREGFRLVPAKAFVEDRDLIADTSGVYAILLRHGDALLAPTGYYDLGGLQPIQMGEFSHLYTGSTFELQTRLRRHLTGDARVSTFRKTLLAMHHAVRVFETAGAPLMPGNAEHALDDWLKEHALLAVRECDACLNVEDHYLRSTPSPLNITNRRAAPFSRRLMRMRSLYDGKAVRPHCLYA